MNNSYDPYGRLNPYYNIPAEALSPQSPKEKPKKKAAGTRDMVFVILCLVVSILSVDFLFWAGAGIGVSACASLALVISLVYLAGRGMKVTIYSIVLSILYFALCASLTFSDGGGMKFLAILLIVMVYTVIILDTMSLRRFEGGTYKAIGDICYGIFALTFGSIGKAWYAVFHKKDGELVVNRKTGSAFIGFAVSLPVLCIIIPILVSSDAAFEGLINKITVGRIFEVVGAIVLGAVFFLLWFGQLFTSSDKKRELAPEKTERGGIDATILSSFLSAISIAYVLYLFSQLAYFFDAFSGLLPEGYTNAEYARRGFFEMVAICAINLLIVFVVSIVSRKRAGKKSLVVRLLSAFVCVFSMVLIATSISKMTLYIKNYGMTHLRIFTSVFCIFLFVLFIAVTVRLFVKKMPYLKIALVTASVLVALMCFCDIDGFIAKYNVEAYLDGRLDTVDIAAIRMLSSDAVVPYVFDLLDDENEDVVYKAKEVLSDHAREMFIIKNDGVDYSVKKESYDFRRYNICEYKARKLLEERFDEYYVTVPFYDRYEVAAP